MTWTPEMRALAEAIAAAPRYPVARLELRRDGDPGYCAVVQGFVHWDTSEDAEQEEQNTARAEALSSLAEMGDVLLEDATRVWVAGDFDVYYKSGPYAQLCQRTLQAALQNPADSGLYPYLHKAYARLTPLALGRLSAGR